MGLLTFENTWAHSPSSAALATAPWTLVLAVPLALAALLYFTGAYTLWQRAGLGRGLSVMQSGAFAAGWLALIVALASPLDTLGLQLFSAHMVQHELLMIVAAPLFVLSRPLEAWTWGLPYAWRGSTARIAHGVLFQATWRTLTAPVSAWAIHALALWMWHVPAFFNAALANEALHVAQHASFFLSALLFWWATLGRAGERRPGLAIVLVFTTMLHTGALGALLTFAPSAWYRVEETMHYGLNALEDQQLGGLIMWIPGGLAYLAAGIVLVFRHYLRAANAELLPQRAAKLAQVPRPHSPQ